MITSLMHSITDIVKYTKDKNTSKYKPEFGSSDRRLSDYAKDSIAAFPLIISSSISSKTLITLVKSLENEYTTYLRIFLSQNQMILRSFENEKGTDILHKYAISTANDFEKSQSTIIKSSVPGFIKKKFFQNEKTDLNNIIRENWNEINDSLTNEYYNDTPINKLSVPYEIIQEVEKNIKKKQSSNNQNNYSNNKVEINQQDIKKATNMQPTLLNIKVFLDVGVKGSSNVVEHNITVGVKIYPHLVSSIEYVYNIGHSIQDNSPLFNLIKWKAGEKKFWRDIVLNIKNIKRDVVYAKKFKSGHLWFNLKHFRTSNKFNDTTVMPTTTFAISMEEVEMLREEYSIDIMEQNYARKLVTVFSLFGFIIVDESIGIVYVFNINDNNDKFDKYPIEYLDRERQNDKMSTLFSISKGVK